MSGVAGGPEHVELGRRIAATRESFGMSKTQLAEAIGVHRTYVRSIEMGTRNMTVGVLLAIAKTLRVDPAYLVKGLNDL